MKRRNLTLSICILAVLALISVGFASWIITNPNSGKEAPGTIIVDDVTSEVFSITPTWDTTSNGKIVFGKPVDYVEKENDWLTSDSTDKENLEAVLTITFNKKDNVDLESILTKTPINVSLKVVDNSIVSDKEEDKELSEISAEKLFSGLTLPTPVITIKTGVDGEGNDVFSAFDGTIDFEDLDENAKCVLKVSFAWGVATGSKNPYVYYNDITFGTETDELDDFGEKKTIEVVAEEYLNSLYEAFTNISYKLTLSDK